jgi:hypothetical protein
MRIALIHALKHSIAPIEASFARLWPEARLMKLLEKDFFASAKLRASGSVSSSASR